jgi:hypothetical protein
MRTHDADRAEYEAAQERYRRAKARRDFRRQHEAEIELRRQMTARLRAEAAMPRWRRLLTAWRGW